MQPICLEGTTVARVQDLRRGVSSPSVDSTAAQQHARIERTLAGMAAGHAAIGALGSCSLLGYMQRVYVSQPGV